MLKLDVSSGRGRSNSGVSLSHLQYAEFLNTSSFLIPDTIAFTKILPFFKAVPGYSTRYKIDRVQLIGYEAYFVEQWISSRSTSTLIVTYTGDKNDHVIAYHVQSLDTPTGDEDLTKSNRWPPQFISYLVEQLECPFSVATQTSLGYAFITNLAQLSPFLSLVDVKTGNIDEDYIIYKVNLNLRKLGCGSRSAANADEPSKTMEDKFKSTFKIDPKIPIKYAVINLIYIVQIFLYYYDVIDPVYCDGLLCEKTENAIGEWWDIVSRIPLSHSIIRVMPPSASMVQSIQAIVGFTVLCRYLLELSGSNFNTPKDPLDVKGMKHSIEKFQKHHKAEITSTFTLETLIKLFECGENSKASQNLAKDLSKMKKLVKNTVIDLTSGKNLHSIAQNATASPFCIHNQANYEHGKMINVQNIDHVRYMSLGKQLSYLHSGSGKPINMQTQALSVLTIKKLAESLERGSSFFSGVKQLKNELKRGSSPSKKPSQVFHDFNFSGRSDDELNRSDDEENAELPNNIKTDVKNDYLRENTINLNLKQKYHKKSSSSLLDISHMSRKGSLTALGDDDLYDDIEIYNPTIGGNKSRNNRLSSITSIATTSDQSNLVDCDESDGSELQQKKSNSKKDKGSSFSSHFRRSKKHNEQEEVPDDIGPLDVNLSGRSLQSAKNARDKMPLKSVFASPHAISTGDFSSHFGGDQRNSFSSSSHKKKDSVSSAKKDSLRNMSNESDGVYEYENGFEYDYEMENNSNSNNGNNSSAHYRKASNAKRSDVSQIQEEATLYTACEDVNYSIFMKRIKRRHSIPLVEPELNQYSIEMDVKMDKVKSLDMRRRHSRGSQWIWDGSSLNSYNNDDNEYLGFELKRKRSMFESQSINTSSSQDLLNTHINSAILYSKQTGIDKLKRSASFSQIQDSLYYFSLGTDGNGVEAIYQKIITPEILAIKYLKMKIKYEYEIVKNSFHLIEDMKRYSHYFTEDFSQEKNLKYQSTRGEVNKAIGKYLEMEEKLKNTTKSNARLKYELRLLLQKTKEVENNVKSLQDFKINTLQSKIDKLLGCYKVVDSADDDGETKIVRESSPIFEMICANDGKIDWTSVTWKNIWGNPYIILYLFFHFWIFTVLKQSNIKFLEQQWSKIDRNQTVTRFIRNIYTTTEQELKEATADEPVKTDVSDTSKKNK